jgi:hypothetical protein
MPSATSVAQVVANFVESDATPSQPSDAAQAQHARLPNLIAAIESRLQSIGESLESRLGSEQRSATVDTTQPQLLVGAASVSAPGCGCASQTGSDPALKSVIEDQPQLARPEQAAFVTGGDTDLGWQSQGLLADVASGIALEKTLFPAPNLSVDQLLASILADIGERFDIDFGPGDGTGCGTAENDAFIPDKIGNIDLTCACMAHDDAYTNPEVTKAEADLAFFGDVYHAAREGGATRFESFLLGGIYYAAVFYFGGPSRLEAQQGLQLA